MSVIFFLTDQNLFVAYTINILFLVATFFDREIKSQKFVPFTCACASQNLVLIWRKKLTYIIFL